MVYYRHMGFAENLRSEMDFQDMQIKELALKTGISKNTLEKYLSGQKAQPGVENAFKIAQVLNVSIEYLVTGKSGSTSRLPTEYESLLNKYQKLNPFNKKTIIDLLDSISTRQDAQ